MLRIFVDHGEAYGNMGDEAMLLSALIRLETHFGKCEFVIPRQGLRPLPALHGFRITEVPSPFAVYCRISTMCRRLCAVIKRIRGQGSHYDHHHSTVLALTFGLARSGILRAISSSYARFEQALHSCHAFYGVGAADFNDFNIEGAAYKCWLYRNAKHLLPVVAVSAQGFGPIGHQELRLLMSRGLRHLDLLSFRDANFSSAFVGSLPPTPCPKQIVGDEAFALPVVTDSLRDEYIRSVGLDPTQPFIVVHWRSTDYTQNTHAYFDHIAGIFDLVAQTTRWPLLFVSMSYDVHSTHDIDCYTALHDRMRFRNQLFVTEGNHDVHLIKALVGAAQFTLGLSYHIHVFGLSQGKPAIILFSGDYYRYKSVGLVAFYGSPNVALDISTIDARIVLSCVQDLLANYPIVCGNISSVNKEIAKVNDWTIVEMKDLVDRANSQAFAAVGQTQKKPHRLGGSPATRTT